MTSYSHQPPHRTVPRFNLSWTLLLASALLHLDPLRPYYFARHLSTVCLKRKTGTYERRCSKKGPITLLSRILLGREGPSSRLYANIESLPRELSTLRELVSELHLDVDSSQFDPRVWVYMLSRILRLLERSLKNIMNRCNPPLKHVIVRSQVVLDVESVNNERLSTLLVRVIFPKLEE